MSNFYKTIKDPRTGRYERAEFLDFGKDGGYKVRFPDGKIFKEGEYKWQELPKGVVLKTIPEWEAVLGIKILDPDGFDRTDKHLYQRVWSQKGFSERLAKCTVEKKKAEPRPVVQNTTATSVPPVKTAEAPKPVNSSETLGKQSPASISADIEVKNVVMRDENGKLLPGSRLNPAGPKPGYKHFKSIAYKYLTSTKGRTRNGDDVMLDEAMMRTAADLALRGNLKAIQFLTELIDGKPKESLDLNAHVEFQIDPKRKAEVLELVGLISKKK